MLDVAASGGYYIALAADTIVAHPTSVTGSIGVVMVTLSAEGLLQKLGLSTTTIKSAERKDMGSPFRALTNEEQKIFQSVIDGLYAQFIAKLAESRKLPLETARKVADGRIYTAQQALDLKLIDRIGYMPDALEVAKRAIGGDEARVSPGAGGRGMPEGAFRGAPEHVRGATRRAPNFARAQLARGEAAEVLGESEEALGPYRLAGGLSPSAATRPRLGEMADRMG